MHYFVHLIDGVFPIISVFFLAEAYARLINGVEVVVEGLDIGMEGARLLTIYLLMMLFVP